MSEAAAFPPAEAALLSVAEMGRADAAAIAGGVPGIALMKRAGAAVAAAVTEGWVRRPVLVLCGPGNNGGDGFIAARLLVEQGWPVRLMLLGDGAKLAGDAALAADRWSGPVEPLSLDLGEDGTPALVIDALFGAGLSKPVDGLPAELLARVAAAGGPVVAVDVPSGLDGDTGQARGAVAPADVTVTFFRRKPGHLLLPGRTLCGRVIVADIGIPDTVLGDAAPRTAVNRPAVWRAAWPVLAVDAHKYRRGHGLVLGGARLTGAARLAGQAARRAGAGLVSIAAPDEAFAVYAAGPPGLMVVPAAAWESELADPRRTAALIGPGAGVGKGTRRAALAALEAGKRVVLDADALTAFAGRRESLTPLLSDRCILTPHDGEFARLFGDLPGIERHADRLGRARLAAAACGAVVVLKGPDSVVAAPDGRATLCDSAPPTLATAGSGDVLAGLALGLLTQGMPAFEAASAAVWLQAAAANRFGPGLIAEDLIDQIPAVLGELAATA